LTRTINLRSPPSRWITMRSPLQGLPAPWIRQSPSLFLSVLSTISCDEDDDPVTGQAAAAGSLAA
jgi:hypothetical protein